MVHQPPLQFQCEMPFGAADEDRFEEFTERLVGDLGGDPQAGDLLLVLDDAQLLHRGAEVGQPEPRGDRVHGPVAGDRQIVFLHGERFRAGGGGQVGGCDHRVAVGGGQQGQPQLVVGAPLDGIAGRRSGADKHVLVGAEQQHGTRGAPPAR